MLAVKEIHNIVDKSGVRSLLLYWKGYLLKPKIVKIPQSFSYKCYVNAEGYKLLPKEFMLVGFGISVEDAYLTFAENLAMNCDSIKHIWIESERRFV